MRGRTLYVLMWKHSKVRLRRFINTPVEWLSTIVIIVLLVLFKSTFDKSLEVDNGDNPEYNYNNSYNSRSTKPDEDITMVKKSFLLEQSIAPQRILYWPETKATHAIMDYVGDKLNLRRFTVSGRYARGYAAIPTETHLLGFVKDMTLDDAIVIFENADDMAQTRKLNYTIRMNENFLPHIVKSLDEVETTHESFGTIYESFMRLQWAVDTSFLEWLTGSPINQKVTLQEMPGPKPLKISPWNSFSLSLMPFCCLMSMMIVFVFLMTRILEERSTGIQELIKMVGVTPNTIYLAHFLNTLPSGLLYSVGVTLLTIVITPPIVVHTSGFFIWLLLFLHYCSVICLALVGSYIVRTTNYGVSVSFFLYMLIMIPFFVYMKVKALRTALFVVLLPHVPVLEFWSIVLVAESQEQPASLTGTSFEGKTLLGVYVSLVAQCCVLLALAWYLEKVRPGKYGVPRPWNFVCKKHYWTGKRVIPDSEVEEEAMEVRRDPQYFEDPPNIDVGIKVVKVSKVFGGWGTPKTHVLSNVSLNIYKGEITILLGHNGAGKTTLISIITGMLKASSGDVFVSGLHTVRQRAELSKRIGLCPQHNLFFPDLTVLEHVMFFTMLKGGTSGEAHVSSVSWLEKLGIMDRAHYMAGQLSGGMKRRLQLCCAFAGGADVLVLDEPTSGLDVETRRELWDLILRLRGERTVLLTTHFLEEADALGDRVVALHGGAVRAHATPLFLKRAGGTGYRLTLVTDGKPKEAEITRLVVGQVPETTIRETTINSISYNLPAKTSQNLPELFNKLESNKQQLAITTIGVGITTLEEVFLQLCKDVDSGDAGEDQDEALLPALTHDKLTGYALYTRQFVALVARQARFIWSTKFMFLLMRIILPVAALLPLLYLSNEEHNLHPQTPKGNITQNGARMDLNMYKELDNMYALYNVNTSKPINLRSVSTEYPQVVFQHSDVHKEILRATRQRDKKYLIGIEVNDTVAKVSFTTTVRHAAPVALNTLTNLLASQYMAYSEGATITTNNHPTVGQYMTEERRLTIPKSSINVVTCALFSIFLIFSSNINAAMLPCQERASGARHVHVMSGCPRPLYWLATFVTNVLVYLLLVVVPVVVGTGIMDYDKTFDGEFLGILLLILTVGGVAFFSLMYYLSFLMSERGTAVALVLITFLTGFITPSIVIGEGAVIPASHQTASTILALFSPPHATVLAYVAAGTVARMNALCGLNKQEHCPALMVDDRQFNTEQCCNSTTATVMSYMDLDDSKGPITYIIIMGVTTILYSGLVMMCEYGLFNGMNDYLFNRLLGLYKVRQPPADGIVKTERDLVNKMISLPAAQVSHSLLVHDLHKNYVRCFKRSCNAVKGVSFSVKKGECFGLLGVNGAGKSTTFKMLTGEEAPTSGDVIGDQHSLRKHRSKYLYSLGYCPQFGGMDNFLTGKQNLTLLLTLRGLSHEDVVRERRAWIKVVGLEKYENRAASTYSGGCVRRLAAASALCSGAPLCLLDEPTAGVDVAARRRVWAALRRGRAARAVLITSHSMDEMEALCDRVAILSGGVVRALGSCPQLRAAHASGHSVRLKLRYEPGNEDAMNQLKSYMAENFDSTLRDEQKSMLHYHLEGGIRYSELFTKTEALKQKFPIIEDYSVTETTLEEVFLAIAKESHKYEHTV